MWRVDSDGLPAAVRNPYYVRVVAPWLHDRIEVCGETADGEPVSMSLLGGFFSEFKGGPSMPAFARYVARIAGSGTYGIKSTRGAHYAEHPLTRLALLKEQRNVLENSFGYGAFTDGLIRDRLADINRKISRLTGAIA